MKPSEQMEVCQFLSETPNNIRLITEKLTIENQRFKPNEKEFSVLEHICHLRDIEEEGYSLRIEKILTEENPFLADIDGDKLAVEREYQLKNLAAELEKFAECRAKSLSLIRKSSLEDLERTGEMEGVGAIKLGKLLTIMLEHDEEHLQALHHLCGHQSNIQ